MNDAMIGLLLAVLAQTGALFYWGGKIQRMVTEHERRITRIEGIADTALPNHAEFRARISDVERRLEEGKP